MAWLQSEETPEATQPDPAEPAGEQEAGNEAERGDATERSEGMEGAEDSEESPQSSVLSPQEQLQAERDQYLALAQRAQADFENYRKRAAKEVAAAGDRAKCNLVTALLPGGDNPERALAAGEEPEPPLAEGVPLGLPELVGVLQRNGIVGFDPPGEPFHP